MANEAGGAVVAGPGLHRDGRRVQSTLGVTGVLSRCSFQAPAVVVHRTGAKQNRAPRDLVTSAGPDHLTAPPGRTQDAGSVGETDPGHEPEPPPSGRPRPTAATPPRRRRPAPRAGPKGRGPPPGHSVRSGRPGGRTARAWGRRDTARAGCGGAPSWRPRVPEPPSPCVSRAAWPVPDRPSGVGDLHARPVVGAGDVLGPPTAVRSAANRGEDGTPQSVRSAADRSGPGFREWSLWEPRPGPGLTAGNRHRRRPKSTTHAGEVDQGRGRATGTAGRRRT